MDTILILPFHGIGHFNGLFGVARALGNTHDVIFAGSGYFLNHVSKHGFTFRTLASHPFGLGLEGWIHEVRKSKYPLLKNIRDRWNDTMYHERKAELTKVLAEYKPVHVLIDTQQATDIVVVKAIDPSIRISLVSLTPPYLLIPGLPPVNSLALPGDSDHAYQQSFNAIQSKALRQRFRYFGLDDRTMVSRRLRRNNLQHLEDVYPSLITLAVKDVDQYILTYKEFDFHHPHLDGFQYVGPHPDKKIPVGEVKSKDKKVIYCSFGTVPSQRDIPGFLTKLNEAIKDLDCELIVGSTTNWIDQSEVLSRSDIFITHGGINSVHDAIRFRVPMIVYPIDSNYDQNGNSSRVVYHGLGLRGDLDHDSPAEIKQKIITLFTDPGFHRNLQKFSSYNYSLDNFIQMLLS